MEVTLCIVEAIVASLASTSSVPITPPPKLGHPKVPPDITKYPGVGVWWEREKSTLVLNYWLGARGGREGSKQVS